MDIESAVAHFNELYFFKEFTYSKNKFRDKNNQELDAADCIVSLDNIMLIFQIKERNISSSTNAVDERKWFENKVKKLAKSQIKDSLKYLANQETIQNRGVTRLFELISERNSKIKHFAHLDRRE